MSGKWDCYGGVLLTVQRLHLKPTSASDNNTDIKELDEDSQVSRTPLILCSQLLKWEQVFLPSLPIVVDPRQTGGRPPLCIPPLSASGPALTSVRLHLRTTPCWTLPCLPYLAHLSATFPIADIPTRLVRLLLPPPSERRPPHVCLLPWCPLHVFTLM